MVASLPSTGRASGLLAKSGFEQMVVDQIVRSIEAFAKLRQDDQFLALQLDLVELWRPVLGRR